MDPTRIVLAGCWISLMLIYLLGDVLRIFAGHATPGRIGGRETAEWMWIVAALVMLVPNWIAQLVLLSVFIVAMIGVRIMVSGRIHRARFILHVMATASPILYLLVLVAALVAGLVSNEASSIVIVTVLAAAAAGLFGIAAIVSFILRRRSVLYGNEMADELYYVVDGQTSGIRSVLIGMCGILREKTSSLTHLVTCSLAHSLTRVR